MRHAALLIVAMLATLGVGQEWRDARRLFGTHGIVAADGSYRATYLRTDLQVQNASGMLLAPEMGLISFAAFTKSPAGCDVKGEICLVKPEIDAVVDDLRIRGIDIQSLGSRLAGETPGLYFLRFHGSGSDDKVAAAVAAAFAELGKDRLVSEGLNRTGKAPIVNWASVSAALGHPVAKAGDAGVMKAAMGQSWVAFGGCPCGRTQLIGLLDVPPQDLQQAIDALRRNKISINSVENLGDSFCLGIEAEGDAVLLAGDVHRLLPYLTDHK